MVSCLGSLAQLCCGEGGALQTNLTGLCGEHSQCFGHNGFAPVHGCVLPLSTLLRLQAALQGAGPELHALPRPKPLRSGSQVLHKDADLVGPAFYAFPRRSGSGNRELEERTLPSVVRLLPSTVPASVSGRALSGASCVSPGELISGCDPPGGCQPSRISGSHWLETGSLFAVW